jgi:hypothetical protein
MVRRSFVPALAGLWLIAAGACSPQPDLKGVKLIPQMTGYVDGGFVAEGSYAGQARLLPSVTFVLKNEGTLPIEYVDLTVAFWRVNDDGEKDSKFIKAIGAEPLAPGASTDTLTVQSDFGYTSPTGRAEFFYNSSFVDFKVKVFARRSGTNASLGEIPVERRLLPTVRKTGLRP